MLVCGDTLHFPLLSCESDNRPIHGSALLCGISGSALGAEESAERLSAYAMAPVNACERHPEWTPYQKKKTPISGHKQKYGSLNCDLRMQITNINSVTAWSKPLRLCQSASLAAGTLENQQLQSYRHR